MIRTIFFIIIFWIVTLITIIALLFIFIFKLLKINKLVRISIINTSRFWSRTLFFSAGSKVKVIGLENLPKTDDICFVSNHQSNFDIPLIIGYIPKVVGFIAKTELKKFPIINLWMTQIGCIFIDRGEKIDSIKRIAERAETIKQGNALFIFPEGTRSKQQEMNEFKTSGLRIIINRKVTIVPLTIMNTYKMYEETKRIKSAQIKLIIHKPINTQNINAKQKDEILAQIEHTINPKNNISD